MEFGSSAASGSDLPSGFRDTVVFEDLEDPTSVRFSSDGRVFVAEKAGKILVFDSLADTTPTVFADFRTDVFDREDRGLLGLVLDPEFPSRPFVYALYTYDHILGDPSSPPKWGEPDHTGDPCERVEGDCEVSGRLVRLTAENGGDHAVPDGGGNPLHPLQDVLVEDWCQQFSSHSIGDLEFDADGALYASGGDGASFNATDWGQHGSPPNPCADPPSNVVGGDQTLHGGEGGALRAQDALTHADPTGLDGSVIRIDPETGQGLPGNPMFGSLDPNERRIVAYGFRNPFRFAIDPASEEIYVGNVGWVTTEEIDRFPTIPSPVYNSGWPCYEGLIPNDAYQGAGLTLCEHLYENPSGVTQPFFHYEHTASIIPGDECPNEEGWAVSGLDFYNGTSFPSEYHGALFFADAVRGCIYVMLPGADGRPDPLSTTTFMSNAGSYSGVNIETGPDGNLYYVKLFGDPVKGSIHKISYDPGAPTARLTASPESGAVPLSVHLDASGSTDPENELLEYEWDLDGNGTFETPGGSQRDLILNNGTQNRTISVLVKDGTGKNSVAKVTVYPGDTPPEPQIETPEESVTWGVGQQIEFAGSAHDDEEAGGEVPDSGLYWKTRLFHCPAGCHAHPLQVFPGVKEGSFIAPEHEYPSHIEFILTATDSRGLSATKTVSINARGVDLRLESDPPGIQLGAGLLSQVAPFDAPVIEGSAVSLAAPATARLDGREYEWTGWSDGGERGHTVVADAPATYVATYTVLPSTEGNGPTPPPPPPPTAGNLLRPTLTAHPPKRTHSRTAKFELSSQEQSAGFRCRLDKAQLSPCHSPRIYRRLRPGKHVFRAVAVAADGRQSAARVFHWTIVCGATQPSRRCRRL
jgi:glucose/arabinose dehydrogenase